MKPLRVGVVGCGVIGPTHMKAAVDSPLMELVAVADLIEERAHARAGEFGASKVYGHGNELIDDPDVDLVVLAVPAGDRVEMPLRALKAGKHLLVEKPVAINSGLVRRMIEAQGGRAAACCSCRFRLLESARWAADVVAGGALGALRMVHVRALQAAGPPPQEPPPPWRVSFQRNGGGILVNWGCYDMDYLLGLCGWKLRPRTVLAQWWPTAPHLRARVDPCSDADDHYVALVRCDGGAVITVERAEFCSQAGETAWRIVGEKGSLRLQMTAGRKEIIHDNATPEEGVRSGVIWEGEDGHAAMSPLVDLAQAIEQGREPATPLSKALVVQQITDAIYASARSGASVEIA
jgi:predicted dehydrogenase